MAVTLSKSKEEIQQLPLVELAWEILKTTKEPMYFRDIMAEIKQMRGLTQDEVDDVIARLYTEINIDGRFLCIGQNVWGLNRWYPVDKVAERSLGGKKFVRRSSGDAFSDDDEDDDEDEDFDDISVEDEDADPLYTNNSNDDADEAEDDGLVEELDESEEEEIDTNDEFSDEEPLAEDDDEDEDED